MMSSRLRSKRGGIGGAMDIMDEMDGHGQQDENLEGGVRRGG